jgi:RNA polymerase sigma-70 factor (ECF subfamily)
MILGPPDESVARESGTLQPSMSEKTNAGGGPGRHLSESDVRALEPVLRAVARRAVRDATAVEDLVQETLLSAIRGLQRFDGRSELRTWVVSILSHKTVDHFRRSRTRREEITDDPGEDDAGLLTLGPRTPETEMSQREALRVLERAIENLPEKERLAIVFCDIEGLERDEVCNVLGVRATHLRVLLHRARHRLRRALEDAGV